MGNKNLKQTIKGLVGESLWTIIGLMLMNLVAQFAVYPVWGRTLGSVRYGNVLTLISYINIFSIAVGTGCNYARMRASSEGTAGNGPFNLVLIAASILCIPLSLVAQLVSGLRLDPTNSALYILLMILMLWRYYGDVDFRLRLDYKGFFFYYLSISIGYGIGILLFIATKLWPLALIVGEAFGFCYVLWKGRVLRDKPFAFAGNTKAMVTLMLTLVATNLLLNLIFNADRILLNALIDGAAVSTFYLASLLGKTVSLVTTPLNSVIIGHTARYDGKLTGKMLLGAMSAIAAVIVLATVCCTIASHILISLLYPQQYEMARPYFLLGNLAQVIYCATNVLTTFLLCFTASKYQLVINTVYALAFFIIGIPAAIFFGLEGFVAGLTVVNGIRLCVACLIGARQVHINKTIEEHNNHGDDQ